MYKLNLYMSLSVFKVSYFMVNKEFQTVIIYKTKSRIGQNRFTYTRNVGNGIYLSIDMKIHLMCSEILVVALGVGESKVYKGLRMV